MKWFKALKTSVRNALGAVVALGVLAGGFAAVDRYFARSSDLQALAGEVESLASQVKRGQVKSDVRALKQERAQLRAAEEKGGGLSRYETERLSEVEEQIKEGEAELKTHQSPPKK